MLPGCVHGKCAELGSYVDAQNYFLFQCFLDIFERVTSNVCMQQTCLHKDDLAHMDTTYFESLTHTELVTVAYRLCGLWRRLFGGDAPDSAYGLLRVGT